jgi:hypothetical protein
MTTSFYRESAKIYDFPVRNRANVAGRRDQAKAVVELALPSAARTVFGSGWYHDAAVQEAERAPKR